jgi:hypothetical protein
MSYLGQAISGQNKVACLFVRSIRRLAHDDQLDSSPFPPLDINNERSEEAENPRLAGEFTSSSLHGLQPRCKGFCDCHSLQDCPFCTICTAHLLPQL